MSRQTAWLAALFHLNSSSAASACRAAYPRMVFELITFATPCSHNVSMSSRHPAKRPQTAFGTQRHPAPLTQRAKWSLQLDQAGGHRRRKDALPGDGVVNARMPGKPVIRG